MPSFFFVKTKMKLKYYQVDAFTENVFKGNPAGVIFSDLNDEILMQKIAFENNLSETAFISKVNNEFFIRWFTPLCEVELCGHATLASAFVFFNYIDKNATKFVVNSKSGFLEVNKNSDDLLCMNFPLDSINKLDSNLPEIEFFLGQKPNEIYKGKVDYLCIFDDESDIINLKPNFSSSISIKSRGIIVTAKSEKYDFVSRCFFPQTGVDEDPVTGSAHTTLMPYWSNILNKTNLIAKQISQRGGILKCKLVNDRVIISGKAVLFLEGEIILNSY